MLIFRRIEPVDAERALAFLRLLYRLISSRELLLLYCPYEQLSADN
jgi:hypothetical protein